MGTIVIIAGVLCAVVSVFLLIWDKWAPKGTYTVLDTAAGVATKAIDIAGIVASYTSLTAIRTLDSVEADPEAIKACDYLRGVITAWKRPAAPAPTLDLASRVAALETKGVTDTVPAASIPKG
jgi:hypothetical protein